LRIDPPVPPRQSATDGRRGALVAFAIFSVLLFVAHRRHAIDHYPYDSSTYWALAVDPWSLPASAYIRGYFFPGVLGAWVAALSAVGIAQVDAFRLFSSLVYSAGLTILLPETCRLLGGGRINLARRLAPALVLVLVFPGLFLYPLSDVPAALLMWAAVLLLLRSAAPDASRPLLLALLAGCAAGAAYNTRTVYLFSVGLLLLVLVLQARARWRQLCCFALGVVLAGLPQLAVNLRMHDRASMDPTVAYVGGQLFLKQLVWGMGVQKYETYLVDNIVSLPYPDPTGAKLLARLSKEQEIDTVPAYLLAVVRNPAPFLGLYGRHFINGLDVRDGRVYMVHPPNGKMLTSFACISVLLIAALALAAGGAGPSAKLPRPALRWTCVGALVLPALVAIPGAMETRFLLPLHMALYVAAAATWSNAAIVASLRARPLLIAALALLAYAAFFAVTQNTLAQVALPPAK
jgi:hypothetical protein